MYNSSNKNSVGKEQVFKKVFRQWRGLEPWVPQCPPAPHQHKTWAWSMGELFNVRCAGQRGAEITQPLRSYRLQPVCKGVAIVSFFWKISLLQSPEIAKRIRKKDVCTLCKVKCGMFQRESLLSLLLSCSLFLFVILLLATSPHFMTISHHQKNVLETHI